MNVISEIKKRLERYPEATFKEEENSISVSSSSSDGFDVWIVEKEKGYTVGFSGWHEEFWRPEEALNCFALGLSEECRLKVTKRGNKECSWTLEGLEGNEWKEDSKTGLLLTPFWMPKSIEFKQNHLIQKGEQVAAGQRR